MPTREEKVAHIEAVLRDRFFPHIPEISKPERNGWTQDQHDTDRLSRCLAACALVKHCGIDDATAAGAITDGSDDGGIDALYFDRRRQQLVFIQSKFKRKGMAPSEEETLKTINGVKTLQARQFAQFNASFQRQLADIEEALDTPGVTLTILLVFLGDMPNAHASNDLNTFCSELNTSSEMAKWQIEGNDQLHEWLIAEQTPKTVDDRVTLEHWTGVTTPHKAFYGQIRALDLAELVQKYGTALFERNIRHYLGSIGLNTAAKTRRRPK